MPAPKPAANRAERAAERRGAIIEAAMDEFIARGFAATRLDDVARRQAEANLLQTCLVTGTAEAA